MTRIASSEHYPWCDPHWCCTGVRHHSNPIVIDTLDAEYRLSLVQMVHKDLTGDETEDDLDPEPRVSLYVVHKHLAEEEPGRRSYVLTEADEHDDEDTCMVTLPSKISLEDARHLTEAMEALLRTAQS